MNSRTVKVYYWTGNPPRPGDRLKSKRGKYLVLGVDWPKKKLTIMFVPRGFVAAAGSIEHPWKWGRNSGADGCAWKLPR